MYKVKYSKKFTDTVILFTDVFYRKNIEQLIDSGLEEEEMIIENYNLIAKNLRNLIFFKTGDYFSQDLVAKNVYHDSDSIFLSIITIHTLRVFIHFTEDISSQTRYIEDIEFFRK